jgi:uncharacterized membrane protein
MNRTAIQAISRLAGLLFGGLFAGFLTGVLVLELSLRRFDGAVYTQLQQVALIGLPILASVLLFPALIATAVQVFLGARSRGSTFWLTVGALALLLAALVTTLVVNVPINLAEGGWNIQSPPEDWASVRDRWQLGHLIRTCAALFAFAALAVAVVRQPMHLRSSLHASA